MKKLKSSSFFRYIPVSEEAKRWGIYVTDLGFTKVRSGSAYPASEHPVSYQFDMISGRVLSEFQIVYITDGQGKFWSEISGAKSITAGDVFLIFPGIRHGYQPDRKTGWYEHWIGFSGDHADRLMREFYDARRPVIQAGLNEDLSTLFLDVCDLTRHEGFGFRHVIAAKTIEIIARLHSLSHGEAIRSSENERMVHETCCLLNDSLSDHFDFEGHAANYEISYSSFRRFF